LVFLMHFGESSLHRNLHEKNGTTLQFRRTASQRFSTGRFGVVSAGLFCYFEAMIRKQSSFSHPNRIDFVPMEAPDIETSSEDYARRFAGAVGEFFLRVQEELCLELLRPWRGCRVLDVGGGHAQLAVPLAAAGYEVTVLGSSPSCKTRLLRLAANRGVEVGFLTGDLLNLPCSDRSYEVVVSLRLLSHVAPWRRLVHELARVAREAVLIDYPSRVSVNLAVPLLFRLKKRVERNTRPFLCFTKREVSDAFRQSGYVASAVQPEFFLPMALHRAVNSLRFTERSERFFEILGLTRFLGSPILLRAEPGHHQRPRPFRNL
jgi:2-polyprenyl-3-methyl-5-hydroxy-6-metoxy-1,4-benzoquinol methylase